MKSKHKSSFFHPLHLSILTFEIILGIFLSFASLAFYAKLLQKTLAEEMVFFDNIIWQFMFSLRSSFLNFIMNTITIFGGEILVFATIIISFYLWDKKLKRQAVFLTALFVSSTFIYKLLKTIVARPRPEIAPLAQHTDFSFPSGHAMNSFVFFTALAYIYYHSSKNKKMGLLFTTAAIIAIILIGASRVYLGVHYATDVLAGYITGLCWFTTAVVIDKTIILIKKNINN